MHFGKNDSPCIKSSPPPQLERVPTPMFVCIFVRTFVRLYVKKNEIPTKKNSGVGSWPNIEGPSAPLGAQLSIGGARAAGTPKEI